VSDTSIVHSKRKPLILLKAKRISTPWVAGSNPAGIATFFEAIALKGTLLSKHPNPQGFSGFPKSARIVRRPKALQANALISCDNRVAFVADARVVIIDSPGIACRRKNSPPHS
jgi:hypothetical protein